MKNSPVAGYKFLLGIILLNGILSFSSHAQSLYEVKFSVQGTDYTGFMVYFNENDAYMRIGYMLNDQYNVVKVKYVAKEIKKEGKNYFFLFGADPEFIQKSPGEHSYNPDHFYWVWADKEAIGLPYVTDNPDFDEKDIYRTTSFKELKTSSITETYLNRFFASNDPLLEGIKQMCGLRTNTKKYEPVETNVTLHLIVIANTSVSDIGSICSGDLSKISNEFRAITKALNIRFNKVIVKEDDFTKPVLEEKLASLKPLQNDVIVFIYRGHGYRLRNQVDNWPLLDMRSSQIEAPSIDNRISLSEVYRRIVAKGARLNLVLGDCCNAEIGDPTIADMNFLASQGMANPNLEKLKRLFIDARGNLLSSSSQPGEVSYATNTQGGFFTSSFFEALHEEISYLRTEDEADWQGLITKTIDLSYNKSKICNGCKKQQTGIHEGAPGIQY